MRRAVKAEELHTNYAHLGPMKEDNKPSRSRFWRSPQAGLWLLIVAFRVGVRRRGAATTGAPKTGRGEREMRLKGGCGMGGPPFARCLRFATVDNLVPA